MKTKLSVLFFLTAALFLSACASRDTAESSTVQQSEIYQDYVVNWADGRMQADAVFRFGGPTGTTLQLTAPSKVTFNGTTLTPSKALLTGTVYQRSASSYQHDVSFEFTDLAGTTYQNTTVVAPLEFIKPPDHAARSQRLLLPVSRIPIDPETSVELSITDSAGKDHRSQVTALREAGGRRNSIYFDVEALSIAVEPDVLKDLPPGPVKVTLRAEKRLAQMQASRLGGSFVVRYQAKPVALTLGR